MNEQAIEVKDSFLAYLNIVFICLIGTCVEFIWASGESVVLPYLKWLGIHPKFLGFTFFINPFFVIMLQPMIGKYSDCASDEHMLGKRLPFIFGLSICASIGLLFVVWSYKFGFMMDEWVVRRDEGFALAAGFTFAGFFVMDICNDLLLIPGRALANDVARNPEEKQFLNSYFTVFQMLGRTMALALGIFPIESWLHFDQSKGIHYACSNENCTHMQSLMLIGGCILLAVNIALFIIRLFGLNCGRNAKVRQKLLIDTSIVTPKAEQQSGVMVLKSVLQLLWDHMSFVLLLITQIAGWCAIMYQSFFWTTWIEGRLNVWDQFDLRISFIGLFLQALISFLTALLLDRINSTFGDRNVYFFGEVTMMIGMVVAKFIGTGIWSIFVAAIMAPGYAIHANNAFKVANMLLEKSNFDVESNKGFIISIVNATMPLAQIIIGGLSGVIVDDIFHGDPGGFFFWLGIIGLSIDIAMYFNLKCS